MAQTTGLINGSDFRIEIAAAVVGKATGCQLDITREVLTANHKDLAVGGFQEVIPSVASGTFTCDLYFTFDSANNSPTTIFNLLKNKTLSAIELTNSNTGDDEYGFSAYCTGYSITSNSQEFVTCSTTWTVSGDVTVTTIA